MDRISLKVPFLWLLFVILLLVLRFIATFMAPQHLWGLDSLAGRDSYWTLFLALFALPLLTKPTLAIGRFANRLVERSGIVFLALVGVLGALFVLFRSRNFLLGDSRLYLHALREGLHIEAADRREAGATLVVSALHWSLRKTALIDSETTFVVASVGAGVLYIILAFASARLLANSAHGRALIFISLLAVGSLQIFFGHAEYYSLVAASGMLYVLFALRWLRGRGSPIWPALALSLALLVHVMNAILLFSFAWLLLCAVRRKRYIHAAGAALLVPATLIILAALIRYPRESFMAIFLRGKHMLPLGDYDPYDYAYGLLDRAHIGEIANELLLAAPCLALLALVILWGIRQKGTEASPDQDGSSQGLGGFTLFLALGAALFSFTANPALGMARDWDIFAFPFMLITLAAAAAIARLPVGRPHILWLCGAVSIIGGLHLALCVDNNRTPSAYADRFRRIAAQDDLFTSVPRGELWRYLGWEAIKANDLEQAREDLNRSIADNPIQLKGYKMLAVLKVGAHHDWLISPRGLARRRALELDSEKKMTAEAARLGLASYNATVVESAPSKVHALLGAGLAGLELGAPDSLIVDAFRRAVEADPQNLEARALWGDMHRLHGNLDKAEGHYNWVLSRRKWQVRAFIGRACVLGARGEPEMGFILVKELREHYPWSIEAQLFLKSWNNGELSSPEDFQRFMVTQ